MRYLQNLIDNELKNMNAEERETYRKTSLITFQMVVDELEDRKKEFERRIFNSVEVKEKETTIYSALIPEKNYYLYEDFLYPVLNKAALTDNRLEPLTDKERILKTVFIKKSYSELKELEGRIFEANIVGNKKYYDINVKLVPDERFLKKMHELHEVFDVNGINWRTFNTAYAMKMYKVVQTDENPDMEAEISKIEDFKVYVDFEELDSSVYDDQILVWNIEERDIIGTHLVRPTEDRIHYEHMIKLNNEKDVYIYPKDHIFLSYKEQETLYVITDNKENSIWKTWIIKKNVNKKRFENAEFPLLDNEKDYNFLNSIRAESDVKMRSEAEVKRIIISFKALENKIIFKDYYMTDKELENTLECYDMNSFLTDEFKLKGRKENLYIYFEIKERDYLTEDLLSFIMSELQLKFHEYNCIGVEYGREI
ncbi:hypothetical protein [Sebaldella sp. S0638]|uniref:hypothetical protein n=1 Tax=Sebaldella sp. S0638 TaxID=2957809 RepID=UPI00209CB4EF|nr:hypothetical protein [Sebaldella sp. S0638]MCP1223055.1 hypothetical protein [Sebaldella sp. S0638]